MLKLWNIDITEQRQIKPCAVSWRRYEHCCRKILSCLSTQYKLICLLLVDLYSVHLFGFCGAGVAVYSRRAMPLAAWTSGLELANVSADADRACLVLETGVNQRWRYGNYQRTPKNTADARAWEAAKIAVRFDSRSLHL